MAEEAESATSEPFTARLLTAAFGAQLFTAPGVPSTELKRYCCQHCLCSSTTATIARSL